MAFEMATGDYLFEPHTGDTYSRDEDHLAHISELLGPIPSTVYKKGQHWKDFFSKNGKLLHIHTLKPWSLLEVLTQKYEWPRDAAESFASFLEPMLKFEQDERATASECLQHPWITDKSTTIFPPKHRNVAVKTNNNEPMMMTNGRGGVVADGSAMSELTDDDVDDTLTSTCMMRSTMLRSASPTSANNNHDES